MPSWIGPWEIAIVVVLILVIFGPRKLPELGSSFGKSIRGFRKGMKEGEDEAEETSAEASVSEATDAGSGNGASTSAAAAAESPGESGSGRTATAEVPRCWGTWEEGNESCMQCSLSGECGEATSQASKGE